MNYKWLKITIVSRKGKNREDLQDGENEIRVSFELCLFGFDLL